MMHSGDRIGIVAMAIGGPEKSTGIEDFLYDRMLIHSVGTRTVPFGTRFLSRVVAKLQTRRVAREYEAIGGSQPDAQHVHDQAAALQQHLNDRKDHLDITFKVYPAMQYGSMSFDAAIAHMKADAISKVVLIPLYPQYDPALAGVLVQHWKDKVAQNGIHWETSFVTGYASSATFVQALSERIDEGLQRFPLHVRPTVELVFSGLGIAGLEYDSSATKCPMGGIVDAVMAHRRASDPSRAFHLAYQKAIGWNRRLKPMMDEKIEQLVEAGRTAMLVVPIAQVSDRVETVFRLDIALREEASKLGVEHYEVASCLNCHPLFISSLGDAVMSKLEGETMVETPRSANAQAA